MNTINKNLKKNTNSNDEYLGPMDDWLPEDDLDDEYDDWLSESE